MFQCLEHTVGLPAVQWRVLDQAHRKRNAAEYEGDTEIEQSLMDALMRAAGEVEGRIRDLRKQKND